MLAHTLKITPHQLEAFSMMINATEAYYAQQVILQVHNHINIYEYGQDVFYCEAARQLQEKIVNFLNRNRFKTISKVSIKLTYSELVLITTGNIPALNNDYLVTVRQKIFHECLTAIENHVTTYLPTTKN